MKNILLVGHSNEEKGRLAAMLRKKGFYVIDPQNVAASGTGHVDLIIAGKVAPADLSRPDRDGRSPVPVLVMKDGGDGQARDIVRRIRLALNSGQRCTSVRGSVSKVA